MISQLIKNKQTQKNINSANADRDNKNNTEFLHTLRLTKIREGSR